MWDVTSRYLPYVGRDKYRTWGVTSKYRTWDVISRYLPYVGRDKYRTWDVTSTYRTWDVTSRYLLPNVSQRHLLIVFTVLTSLISFHLPLPQLFTMPTLPW